MSNNPAVGDVVEGKVVGIKNFGAFVELEGGVTGLVHISEIARAYVKEVGDFISLGQTVSVKVLAVGENNRLNLSIKAALPAQPEPERAERPHSAPRHAAAKEEAPQGFEAMMDRFKKQSDEKIGELKRSVNHRRGGGYSRKGSGKF